ncbi:MAG: protein yaiI [Firmicutes bacterium]|nr:protein yaiI [Bacillota bacterium]
MKILIDADACPKKVLQICMDLGAKYAVKVWTVASFNHNIISDYHVVVGDNDQETDIKVLNLAESGDIIITQDWGLAAMALGKRARCISPAGREFRNDNIDFLLEERDMKAKLRRSGGRTKGPNKRTIQEDIRFQECLAGILGEGIKAT